MIALADTSAIYALMDADDANHARAAQGIKAAWQREDVLLITNYIAVECAALVQNRLGTSALRVLLADILPVVTLEWVDEDVHATAVAALIAARRRSVSLVDVVSFEA